MSNYQHLLKDDIFWQALAAFIHLPAGHAHSDLSFPSCWPSSSIGKLPGINVFPALYFIPVISGSIAVGISWRLMLDTNGLMNGFSHSLGMIQGADPVAG